MNEALSIDTLPINQLMRQEIVELYEALETVKRESDAIKRKKQWIEGAIALKFEEQIRAKRERLEKNTGLIHLDIEGFKLTQDIPKKVEWDQKKLGKIWDKLRCESNKLTDYIDTIYHISEANYNGLAHSARAIFDPARIVKLGKSTYKIAPIETHLVCEGWV